jgi:hypothetical protein
MSLIGLVAVSRPSPIRLRGRMSGSKQSEPHGRFGRRAIADTGGPLNIFQLKLVPRLLLASLPVFAAGWLDDLLEMLTGFSPWFFSPTYGVLFGLLVLAPFITSSRAQAIRVLALMAIPYFVYYWAVFAVVQLNPWPHRDLLQFAHVIPIAMVATWALAAATALIAPLRVTRRYWMYTGLAGFATGFDHWMIDNLDPPESIVNWVIVINPYWIWTTSTCAAIYYGRDREPTG